MSRLILICIFCTFAVLRCPANEVWSDSVVEEHIQNVQNTRGALRSLFLVSEHLSEEKSDWLDGRLESIKRENFSSSAIFKVLETQVEKDFAIALVSAENARNPLYYEVLSMPFCRTEKGWKAAPLFGSFSLTGRGVYDPQDRVIRERLELWSKEKSAELRVLGQKNSREVLAKKKAKFSAAGMPLRDGSKEDAVRFFFECCQSADSAGILSCSDTYQDALSAGLMKEDSFLSKLLNRDYLFTVIGNAKDAVHVAIYYPLARQKPGVLKFYVSKRAGCWELLLPDCLRFNDEGELNTDLYEFDEDRGEIENHRDQLKGLMAKSIQHVQTSTAESASAQLLAVLNRGDFHTFMRLFDFIAEGENLSDVKQLEKLEKQFGVACKLWRSLQCKNSQQYLCMYSDSGDGVALNVLASYSPTHPTAVKAHTFAFHQREGNWLLVPPNKSLKSVVGDARWKKLTNAKKEAPEQCEKQFFADISSHSNSKSIAFKVEDKASLERFASAYLASLDDNNLQKSIAYHTYDEGAQHEVLRAIGNDFRSVKSRVSTLKIKNVLIHDKIAFLVFYVEYRGEVESSYFAYPVIQIAGSSQKLSILSHYAYRFEHGRGEKMQNAAMLVTMKAKRDLAFSENYLTLVDEFNDFVKSQTKEEDTK